MKKLLVLFIISTALSLPQELPFHKGVNITNWFQAANPGGIQFNKFNKKDFERIKSLGGDVIRLPINLHFMTSGTPDYTLDPLFLNLLDQVVDWAEELEINLIIDNHTFDVTIPTANDIDRVLIPVWTQMAGRYKNRSNLIYYEILNEPHGIEDSIWNRIQLSALNAIRDIDSIHTVIVGGASWNSYNTLSLMPAYSDTNLIYTFHFYDPFIFTHQGATWGDPPLESLAGVPFPYNAPEMPACPDTLRNTWVESNINNYINDGTENKIKSLIDIAYNFKINRNVRIYCGEMGVLMNNAPDSDRTYWYSVVREYLESKNIPWTIWDYKGSFGLFEKNSNELFDYDLNLPLVNALGFTEPFQQDWVLNPDSSAFDIYTDNVGENILGYGSGTTDFYNSGAPQEGRFAIYWTAAQRYNAMNFSFKPIKDLSYLVSQNYLLDLFIKAFAEFKFDIRFIDTKADESDHPWRIRYTIDTNLVDFDGTWQHLRIPLKNFTEHGSWDGAWYNPEGKFDWAAVERFEIVPEYSDMGNAEIWFDNIKIVDQNAAAVENDKFKTISFGLSQNYPNPFNPRTLISYSLPAFSHVSLKVYDILGNEIVTLVNEEKQAGNYHINFNGSNLSSGIYFYKLQTGNFAQIRKMILVK